jgi:hypothetical protein
MSVNNQDQTRMGGTPMMPGQGTRGIAPDGENVARGQYGLASSVPNPAGHPGHSDTGESAAGTSTGLPATNSTIPSSTAAAGNLNGAQPMDWEPGDAPILHQLNSLAQILKRQQQEHHQLVAEVIRMREKQEYPVPVLTEVDTLFPEASVNPVFTTDTVQDQLKNVLKHRFPPNCNFPDHPQEYDDWAYALINEFKLISDVELAGHPLPEPLKLQLAARTLPSAKSRDWIAELQRKDQAKQTFKEYLIYFRHLWGQQVPNADLKWEWQDLRQTGSVKEFIRVVKEKAAHFVPRPSADQVYERILGGLKERVRDEMRRTPIAQVPDFRRNPDNWEAWVISLDTTSYRASRPKRPAGRFNNMGEDADSQVVEDLSASSAGTDSDTGSTEDEDDEMSDGQLNAMRNSKGRFKRSNRKTKKTDKATKPKKKMDGKKLDLSRIKCFGCN